MGSQVTEFLSRYCQPPKKRVRKSNPQGNSVARKHTIAMRRGPKMQRQNPFIAALKSVVSAIGLQQGWEWAKAAIEAESAPPIAQPEARKLRSRDWNEPDWGRRARFLARYRANPMNYVPGNIGATIYRVAKDQKRAEIMAADWLAMAGVRWPGRGTRA